MNDTWLRMVEMAREFAGLSGLYILIAIALRGRGAIKGVGVWAGEFRLNALYLLMDTLFVVPLLIIAAGALVGGLNSAGLIVIASDAYINAPVWAVGLGAVFVGDFVGYWRHRLMHTPALWPAHAIHHSDRHLTWLALARFHPLNRLISVVLSAGVLAVLGVPGWAILLNGIVHHHYGYFVHANIPLGYGPLGRIFVSPVMHRWHHVRDYDLAGNNFATVFSFIDVMFGTYYVPHKNVGDLGIEDYDFPSSWLGQFAHPFKVWLRRYNAE